MPLTRESGNLNPTIANSAHTSHFNIKKLSNATLFLNILYPRDADFMGGFTRQTRNTHILGISFEINRLQHIVQPAHIYTSRAEIQEISCVNRKRLHRKPPD